MSSSETPYDGAGDPRDEPDVHGQAALLLAESILHTMVETKIITVAEGIQVVETAAEVKEEVATEAGESTARMEASINLLNAVARSLRVDSRDRPPLGLV